MSLRLTESRAMNRDGLSCRAGLGWAVVLLSVHGAGLLAAPRAATAMPLRASNLQLRLDPNRATAGELELLPRIGPKIAELIVAYRETADQTPAFCTAEDLDRVKHVGPVTIEGLRPHLRFPNAVAEPVSKQENP